MIDVQAKTPIKFKDYIFVFVLYLYFVFYILYLYFVFGLSIQKCSTMASLIFFFLNIGSYYIDQVALELDLPTLAYFCVGITSDASTLSVLTLQ